MNKKNKETTIKQEKDPGLNSQLEGNKAPGEEQGKKEKVTTEDLKGKKVDADPAKKDDQPTH